MTQHRHLNHEKYTLAAIDDIILRGKWEDWSALRRAALADRAVMKKIEDVCQPYLSDPYRQRHYFWTHWVRFRKENL